MCCVLIKLEPIYDLVNDSWISVSQFLKNLDFTCTPISCEKFHNVYSSQREKNFFYHLIRWFGN